MEKRKTPADPDEDVEDPKMPRQGTSEIDLMLCYVKETAPMFLPRIRRNTSTSLLRLRSLCWRYWERSYAIITSGLWHHIRACDGR